MQKAWLLVSFHVIPFYFQLSEHEELSSCMHSSKQMHTSYYYSVQYMIYCADLMNDKQRIEYTPNRRAPTFRHYTAKNKNDTFINLQSFS